MHERGGDREKEEARRQNLPKSEHTKKRQYQISDGTLAFVLIRFISYFPFIFFALICLSYRLFLEIPFFDLYFMMILKVLEKRVKCMNDMWVCVRACVRKIKNVIWQTKNDTCKYLGLQLLPHGWSLLKSIQFFFHNHMMTCTSNTF